MSDKAKKMTSVKIERDTAALLAMIVRLRRRKGGQKDDRLFRATDLIRELIEEKYPDLVAAAKAELTSDDESE